MPPKSHNPVPDGFRLVLTLCLGLILVLQAKAACYFSLGMTNWDVPADGAVCSTYLSGTTGCAWTSSTPVEWARISPTNGTGSRSIMVVVDSNLICLARSATLTIAGKSLTINQAAGSGTFTLSATSWYANDTQQSTTIAVIASTGCNWSVENPAPDWVTVVPSTGTGIGTTTITVAPNSTPSTRNCSLTIAGKSFWITQASFGCSYTLDPAVWMCSGNGDSTNVQILTGTDCIWSVFNLYEWITVTPTNGADNGFVTISVQRNSTGSPRSATVTIAGQIFSVLQPVQDPQPGPITLLKPAEGQNLSHHDIDFGWTDAETNASKSEWYRISVFKQGAKYIDQWFKKPRGQLVMGEYLGYAWTPTNVLAAGEYTWTVQGWNTNGFGPVSQTGTFTAVDGPPSAPTLLAPHAQTNINPELAYSWTSDPLATWYELCVIKNGAIFADDWFHAPFLAETNCVESLPGHSTGQYSWWVRAWNPDGMSPWSSMASFTVALSPPGALTLLCPTNDLSLVSGTLSEGAFSWSPDSTAEWYCLWINRNGTNHLTQWLRFTGYHVYLPIGNYTWQVQAWNAAGFGPKSTTASFTCGALHDAPVLSSPTNSQIMPPAKTIQFQWKWVPYAEWYCLKITRDGTNALTQWVKKSGPIMFFDLTNAPPPGAYTWSVQPWNAAGYGPSSTNLTFTVAAYGTPISPLGTVSSNSFLWYTWYYDPAATWFELHITKAGSPFYDRWHSKLPFGDFALFGVKGHTPGEYTWRVREWSPINGLYPWSDTVSFTMTP